MNASAPAAEACTGCGAALPANARFCPSCGTQVGGGETVRADLPPTETGPVPVSYQVAEPHWFGVAPPQLLLGLAVIAVVLALVLFATGHWPYALILLGIGALLVAAFLEAARRRPQQGVGLASARARERAQSTLEMWRARSAAAGEFRQLRSSLIAIESDRRGLLHELGIAVHREDAHAQAAIRAHLAELDSHEAWYRAQLDASVATADERIRKARLPVQDTMMVMPSEPTPPPGEATPPQPAVVPEAYPPPDEATPPQPARVPEPSPDPGPAPGSD